MKRCPTCDKTFDDAMRFCQSDGTPLVPDEPLDPYKTMVARPANGGETPPVSGSLGSSAADEDHVLELPSDPGARKTTFTTEEEIRREMAARDADDAPVIDIPPLAGTGEPASSLNPPSFGDMSAPPPSPLSENDDFSNQATLLPGSMPPIPSPFGESRPAESEFSKPSTPPFAEPGPVNASPVNPFDMTPEQQRSPISSEPKWNPPPPPVRQEPVGIPSRPMDRPAPVGAASPNQTMAIISLVLGILSIVLCQITGPVAVVTGMMARKKATQNPAEYGGAGLAMGGIITGAIGTILLVLVALYFIAVFGLIAGSSIR